MYASHLGEELVYGFCSNYVFEVVISCRAERIGGIKILMHIWHALMRFIAFKSNRFSHPLLNKLYLFFFNTVFGLNFTKNKHTNKNRHIEHTVYASLPFCTPSGSLHLCFTRLHSQSPFTVAKLRLHDFSSISVCFKRWHLHTTKERMSWCCWN